MKKNKKGDISIQIVILAAIAIIVMVVMVFIFTGKARFFTKTITSCSQIGICADGNGCDDPDYPIEVMTEDKTCEYTKERLTIVKFDDKKHKKTLCCQRLG